MPNEPVRQNHVFIVEDDDALRVSLHRLLETAGFQVLSFLSAEAMLERLDGIAGGCVITDFRMPGKNGLDLQKELLKRWSDFRLIMMSAVMDTRTSVEAIKAGAVDVLDKPVRFEVLEDAINEALESLRTGTFPASHISATMMAEQMRIGDAVRSIGGFTPSEINALQDRYNSLSPRERQVADLVFDGSTNGAIGIKLGIAGRTVEKHRAKVMSKLGVKSVAEFARVMTALQEARSRRL